MKRKIIGIIPVRFFSKRLPGKALAVIHGYPMIRHVYTRAKKAKALDRLIVATDDKRIFNAVKEFGGEVRLTSPRHLSGTDRVAEAASKENLKSCDIVVNIQGDEPLLKGKMIDELVSPFKDRNVVMSTLIHKAPMEEVKDENIVKVVFDNNHNAIYFSRSPIPLHGGATSCGTGWKHLGFYAYTYKFLKKFTSLPQGRLEKIERLEQLRALEHGYNIKVVETRFDTVGVDTRADLYKVRRIMSSKGGF
ncbi:MAG: 3-deoxy-manno-octulosonate cytidylyltransferase [Candidatus Omnitrophica bacterium]|nr:3-deoxy-manno-octulosonate cytidylyltransferase [Candidatus Omnitrophota bacterium]